MGSYAYAITRNGEFWNVVNRGSRAAILGPYLTQSDAEKAAEQKAKARAKQGHKVRVRRG